MLRKTKRGVHRRLALVLLELYGTVMIGSAVADS
eukprot:SAG11_NODE_105_length_16528_cov_4.337635_11_plen_34_part_00